jgi:hypothetical protein
MANGSEMLGFLSRIVGDSAKRVYVLMDGARFDDLPGMLAAGGLYHRSLYRNVQDAELVRAGPWLVDPYRDCDPTLNVWGGLPPPGDNGAEAQDAVAGDIEAALKESVSSDDYLASFPAESGNSDPIKHLELIAGMAGESPASVFWIGDASLTEASLWRHLRTLNMALIPKGYGEDDPPPLETGAETHDALMFRHADGNVLAEVLPVLDAAQFSRVFGPAKVLMFLAPDHPASVGSTVRRAVLPDDAAPAPPGMLKLSIEQMEAIEEIRFERSQLRITRYLRNVAPEQAGRLSDVELNRSTALWMQEAQGHGVKSEAALGRWTYLQLITIGEIGKKKEVTDYLRQGNADRSTDERVQHLMQMAAYNAARS